MRLAHISARLASGEFVCIAPPGNPRERSDAFKALVTGDRHPAIAEIQLWDSGQGIVKRKKFDVPADAPEFVSDLDALALANEELAQKLRDAEAQLQKLRAAAQNSPPQSAAPVSDSAPAESAPSPSDAPPAQPAETAPAASETPGAGQAASGDVPRMDAARKPRR